MVDRLSGEMGLLFCLVVNKISPFLEKTYSIVLSQKKVVLPKSLPSWMMMK
jgi:hypothetical protein